MAIELSAETVYRSTRYGRRFLTLDAAIAAEAREVIRQRHPTEPVEPDVGYPGFHWRELSRSDVLYRRVRRLILSAWKTWYAEQRRSYATANPLGGPAKVFEAAAQRIRAGESLTEVMDDYGLAWTSPAKRGAS